MILEGKINMKEVSIITGASGTLGKSVTEALLKRNHTVLAISRHSLNKKNKNYYELNIDLSNLENIEDNKNEILKIFKIGIYEKINIIHIAGRYVEQRLPLKYDEINKWNEIFNINCFSFYYIVSILYEEIKKINNGTIIAVSSNLTERVNANTASYIASKAALEVITKQLAYELGQYNTNCNSISPGVFFSKMSSNISTEKMEEIKRNTPLNRIIDETEIKDVILTMLEDKMSWITGQNIIADGGNTIGF